MGLDMYLYRQHYVQRWDHIRPDKQHTVTVLRGTDPHPNIKMERVKFVTEQVAYWRKANAIHSWFVRNVQDGKESERPTPTLFWDIVTILMLLAAIAIWSLIVAGFQNW